MYNWPLTEGEDFAPHIQELLELEQEVVSKYIVKVQAPNIGGKHDDMSDAIARMVWCASQDSTRVKKITGSRNSKGKSVRPGVGNKTPTFGRSAKKSRKSGFGSHSSRQKR